MPDTVTIDAIEAGVPMLVEARSLIDSFHSMICKKMADDLEPWIVCASNVRLKLDGADVQSLSVMIEVLGRCDVPGGR